ncbi:hypothetical protein [Brevibacillus sp. H7]|uniref:hypothetical protein n=1 Tax=Brevibacillus sp. H7 TaxID=3349138 RepID=UPI00382F4002
MAKVIYICKRSNSDKQDETEVLKKICCRITPDHLQPNPPVIMKRNGVHIGIFNPNESILLEKSSVCLGHVIGTEDRWFEPTGKLPDGAYALFRSNSKYVELVSDVVGSRTIWYLHTDDLFIASTSQRMIITYLGKYKPNKKVYPWMLATGTLGPNLSWDERLVCLPADARITLDRETWKTRIETNSPHFKVHQSSYSEHKERLTSAIKETFNQIHFDYSKWVVPLSGGVDSRAVLLFLANRNKMNTITWGMEASRRKKETDPFLAKLVSDFYGCTNEFYNIDFSNDESLDIIFDRFLKNGEGRMDGITCYVDGFSMWKVLHDKGTSGIIRGDEVFGLSRCENEKEVKAKIGIDLISDDKNLSHFLYYLGMEPNSMPNHLKRKENETLEVWRDRLYHQFRIPVVLAALNDLKLSYVEIANPFLSRRIILEARTLPDELRSDKRLFRDIVHSLGPDIGYAKTGSIKNILKRDQVVAFIKKEIQNSEVLPDQLTHLIMENMLNTHALLKQSPYRIDYYAWGFRAYMIKKMNKILKEDAAYLKRSSRA